jgi:flagellar biosynthetic protein FlhB
MADYADSRTERATPRRKAEARRKGHVPVSRDVSTVAVLLGGIGVLWIGWEPALTALVAHTREWLSMPARRAVADPLTVEAVRHIMVHLGADALVLTLPMVASVAVVGAGASLVQTGFLWRSEALRFDLARLSPLAGLRRMVSLRSAAELIKALVKMLAVGAAGVLAVRNQLGLLPELVAYDVWGMLSIMGWLSLKAAGGIALALAAVAAADYAYQRFEWERSLRMTRQEVKEELREAEGDPAIRSRVKRVQREMAKKRMMAAVPAADVVVRNPTHYAVALQYDQAKMAAPVVVAKGAGYVAERIIETARAYGVPVVEDKVVARTLYTLVDVGREIPTELYRAVAEILAFVYRARGTVPRATGRG